MKKMHRNTKKRFTLNDRCFGIEMKEAFYKYRLGTAKNTITIKIITDEKIDFLLFDDVAIVCSVLFIGTNSSRR